MKPIPSTHELIERAHAKAPLANREQLLKAFPDSKENREQLYDHLAFLRGWPERTPSSSPAVGRDSSDRPTLAQIDPTTVFGTKVICEAADVGITDPKEQAQVEAFCRNQGNQLHAALSRKPIDPRSTTSVLDQVVMAWGARSLAPATMPSATMRMPVTVEPAVQADVSAEEAHLQRALGYSDEQVRTANAAQIHHDGSVTIHGETVMLRGRAVAR